MTYNPGNSSIFTRYDLSIEVMEHKVRKVSDDLLLQRVADCIVAGDDEEIGKILGDVLEKKNR